VERLLGVANNPGILRIDLQETRPARFTNINKKCSWGLHSVGVSSEWSNTVREGFPGYVKIGCWAARQIRPVCVTMSLTTHATSFQQLFELRLIVLRTIIPRYVRVDTAYTLFDCYPHL